ncbi:MAG: aspartate aminotransferase family protein, partial [Microbacterium sp.]
MTDSSIDLEANARVRADDRGHVFHSWSAQALIDPHPVAGGEGASFWDYEGNTFLDFSSQLVNLNLGHQHRDLVAAIQEQAGRLATIQPSMANDVRGELARRIS